MTFTRPRNSIHHNYNIRNHPLLRVDHFCDLGIIFESNLSLNKQSQFLRCIQYIIS